MTEQEIATGEALKRLHPELCALFNRCHGIIDAGIGPGDSYLLAVAARELTVGLARSLESLIDPSIWDDGPPSSDEGHRVELAKMLSLPKTDPMVTQWLAAHQLFNTACHWGTGVSPGTLMEHFRSVSAILVTRLGPFFDTEDDLDRLAALQNPTIEDSHKLRALLLLPVQREHFFERVESPEWLDHLVELNSFGRLPLIPPADRWQELARWASWPEGRYLERIAGSRPDDVHRILLGAPSQSANPLVWLRIVKAALNLPIEFAAELAEVLSKKLNTFAAAVIATEALELATRLLKARAPQGLNLLSGFLSLTRDSSLDKASSSKESAWRLESEPIFDRLPGYAVDDLAETALPAAAEADPITLARRLRAVTKKAIGLAVPEGRSPSTSKTWCRSLDDDNDRREVRATLLGFLARTLVLAVRVGPEDAVDELLERVLEETHDAFVRVMWYVLAHAGDRLPARLSTALVDDRLLHDWWGSREAALLLRNQLSRVSYAQQQIVRHAFERGPAPAELTSILSWRALEEPSDEDMKREIEKWQRTRLRWFRGNIPHVLQALAKRLGVLGQVPSLDDQELAEDHSTTGRVGWVVPTLAITSTEWGSWSATERVTYLRKWRPEEDSHFTSERAGLYQLLLQFAEIEPSSASEMIRDRSGVLPLGAVVPFLEGFKQAIDTGKHVGIEWIAQVTTQFITFPSQGVADDPWRFQLDEALEKVLRLAVVACRRDQVKADELPYLVKAIEAIARASVIFEQGDAAIESTGFARASFDGWNRLGGGLVDAVVELGLSLYRTRSGIEREVPFDEHSSGKIIQALIKSVLDDMLDLVGIGPTAARHQIGQYLSQFWLLDSAWVRIRVVPHFATGIADPDADPVWPAYLAWSPLYDDLFREWAAWYSQAAKSMPVDVTGSSGERGPFAGLLGHMFFAYLRGLVELSDPAGGVSDAFRRAQPPMLAHLYWRIFRDLGDASDPPPESTLDRLELLWMARVDALEAGASHTDTSVEANGLAWFLASDQVTPGRALRLGLRIVPMLRNDLGTLSLVWNRLELFSRENPSATIRLIGMMLRAHSEAPFPHVDFEGARAACSMLQSSVSDSEWQELTETVADLARHGWRGVRKILP